MANSNGNGRNVVAPDENRASWRPEDESEARNRRRLSEDEHIARSERDYPRERFAHWEDQSSRWDRDDDRSAYGRGFEDRARERDDEERFSQSRRFAGSGYGHGEYRPNEYRPSEYRGAGYLAQGGQEMGDTSYGDQQRYGSSGHRSEEGGFGQERASWREPRMQATQGRRGVRRGYVQQPERYGGRGVQDQGGLYGQGGYDEGTYGQGGMQHRYGSQGYQGWGQQPSHRGKGPVGYTRSDERIRELVCEELTEDDHVDATHIEVSVKNGEVTLSGTVEDRHQKRMAENVVELVPGVKDVHNQLRVGEQKRESSTSGGH